MTLLLRRVPTGGCLRPCVLAKSTCVSHGKKTLPSFDAIFVERQNAWWRHQMETFSALLAFCAGNSPVHGEFPTQRPVTRSFDIFFDLRLNKRLSKQSWGWWSETPSSSLWRHRNGNRVLTGEMPSRHYGVVIFCIAAVQTLYPCFYTLHNPIRWTERQSSIFIFIERMQLFLNFYSSAKTTELSQPMITRVISS